MPKDKDFKRLVRERAIHTGESYTAARAQLLARRRPRTSVSPVVCAVTGAGGRVAYNLLFRLAAGEVFGPDVPVIIRLVDVEEARPSLEGVVIELEDCAYPLLAGIDATSDWGAGFDGASWVVMLGAPRRVAGMERRDLLAATASSFTAQGHAVERAAAPDVQLLVVGNPANTNCLVARHAAPSVPHDRWHAMLRLDHNRARSQLAARADVPLDDVRRVKVWGNHSPTMVPDVWHASIAGRPAIDAAGVDEAWISEEFVPGVQQRGARLIDVAGSSSAASAAVAVVDALQSCVRETPPGDWVTDGVVSRGEYGVPEGLQFGYPVTVCPGGAAAVVEGLEIGPVQRHLLAVSIAELVDERRLALALIR